MIPWISIAWMIDIAVAAAGIDRPIMPTSGKSSAQQMAITRLVATPASETMMSPRLMLR
jgi:hypothetical protein